MREKLKVLAIAELCNPNWASVPLVGWKHVENLSKVCDLSLVTHEYNRENIEESGKQFQSFYVRNRIADALYQWIIKNIFAGEYASASITFIKIPFYFLFECKVILFFLRNYKKYSWQLVHRITPVSPILASPIAIICKLLRIPFIIGPLNGGLPWPKGYDTSEKSVLANIRWLYKYDLFIWVTRSCAERILCGSHFIQKEIPQKYAYKCRYAPENGIEYERIIDLKAKSYEEKLRCVFVGRMVALKCPHLVAQACWPFILEGQITLDFFGDGTEREGIEKKYHHQFCRFHGWISSQAQLVQQLENYDVLVFPSIKEFGGGVVIECMAKGLVPIVMNYGGPGEIVDEASGYRLPIANEQKTVEDIQSIIKVLINNRHILAEKAEAAVQRIQNYYTWEKKAEHIEAIYREIVDDKHI